MDMRNIDWRNCTPAQRVERNEEIWNLTERGLSTAEIAAAFKMAQPTVFEIVKLLKREAKAIEIMGPDGRRIRDDEIVRLRAAGHRADEIGRLYGMTSTRVRQICDAAGVMTNRQVHPKEPEILEMLAAGASVGKIHRDLGVSERMVRRVRDGHPVYQYRSSSELGRSGEPHGPTPFDMIPARLGLLVPTRTIDRFGNVEAIDPAWNRADEKPLNGGRYPGGVFQEWSGCGSPADQCIG